MEKIKNLSPEVQTFKWWSKIRWFIVLILFAIGILRVTQVDQTYPIVIFVASFVGIGILNILFYLQILKTNIFFSSLQIVLDIIFATVVVHLTGGLDSAFVWIYLLAVISASLVIEKSGGIIAAMIGSMSLLMLILMYNFGWLIPVDGLEFVADIPTQTIFLISYTGLFSGVAFISSNISHKLKQYSVSTEASTKFLEAQKLQIKEKTTELENSESLLDKYKEVVHEAAEVSRMDHDLNNPLTIISLSIRRIIEAGQEHKDEKLEKSGNQMSDAIDKINNILTKFQKFKQLDLIKEERNKNGD